MKVIRKRKNKLDPPPPVNRSKFIEWNRNSELFAFSKRLHEQFNPQLLQEAFTLRSYIIQEEQKQTDVGIENPVTNLKDNTELARIGSDLLSTYVEMFIASHLPKLPDVGIRSVRDYLLSDEVLANVSKHIGTNDLILSAVSQMNELWKILVCFSNGLSSSCIGIPTRRSNTSDNVQSNRWCIERIIGKRSNICVHSRFSLHTTESEGHRKYVGNGTTDRNVTRVL